jgi:ABC-type phosphate transport system auxiliary subunit
MLILSDKLINNSNLQKLAKALDDRSKQQVEEEKLRAEAKENELNAKIDRLREEVNNSGGSGSGSYNFHYNEDTEEITISGILVTYDEESEGLQIGGAN